MTVSPTAIAGPRRSLCGVPLVADGRPRMVAKGHRVKVLATAFSTVLLLLLLLVVVVLVMVVVLLVVVVVVVPMLLLLQRRLLQ